MNKLSTKMKVELWTITILHLILFVSFGFLQYYSYVNPNISDYQVAEDNPLAVSLLWASMICIFITAFVSVCFGDENKNV